MFNRIIMLGNITRECELRYLQNGGAVCTTGLATNRRYKKQDGSPQKMSALSISHFLAERQKLQTNISAVAKKCLSKDA